MSVTADFAVLNNFYRTFRQCLHKGAAVGLGHDSIVQDHNDATVGLGADQSSNASAKFQDRFGQ
jgi:hypothetical protein